MILPTASRCTIPLLCLHDDPVASPPAALVLFHYLLLAFDLLVRSLSIPPTYTVSIQSNRLSTTNAVYNNTHTIRGMNARRSSAGILICSRYVVTILRAYYSTHAINASNATFADLSSITIHTHRKRPPCPPLSLCSIGRNIR